MILINLQMNEINIDDIKLKPLLDTLWFGKLEDKVYFSEPYADYISNSRLGLLKREGPKAFFDGFAGQSGYNPSFLLGTLVHSYTLQRDLFEIVDVVDLPTAKLGGMADYMYKYYLAGDLSKERFFEASDKIDYYKDKFTSALLEQTIEKCTPYWEGRKAFEEQYTGGKELLYCDPVMREKAYGCISALEKNPYVQRLLHPVDMLGNECLTLNEYAILIDVEVSVDGHEPFIVKLKAKLDNMTLDKTSNILTINDVKTTIKDTRKFYEAVHDYQYMRELSMYATLGSLVAEKYYGMQNPEIRGNFLVVTTKEPYYTTVFPMNKELWLDGVKEFKYLLKVVCHYKYYGYEQ